jgi:Outer membrane protein beta-barrel domain
MRPLILCSFALGLAGACAAQQYELGASGGFGFSTDATVKRGSDTAEAGLKPGPVLSVFVVQNMYKHLGGEIRYSYQMDDLKVSSAGTEATFSAQTHSLHYDLLYLAGDRDSRVRPFVAVGGGVKVYRGTGAQHATQNLGQFVALTQTQEIKPLISFGGGVKMKLSGRLYLHVEARDYLTPFPTKVIAPVPPSTVSGWVHDFVPLVGISMGF